MDSDNERLEVGALSETGFAREENQDRMSGSRVPLGHLYIVADGMGGHKGGAVAAQIAVEELQRHISQAAAGEPADAVIAAAFKAANDAVYKRAHSGDSAVEGMGTTAVLVLVADRSVKLAHVGDSRAYLYRNNKLSRLTTDHTVVQRMVEAGMLKPEEAADHPQSSVLERAIGSAPTVEVDMRDHRLQEGDALLLCSDGLCGYVADAEIEAALRREGPIQETTLDLVQLALDTGGRDNITVQLISYGARKPAAPPTQTRPAKAPPPPAPSTGVPARRGRGLISQVAAFIVAGLVAGAATAGGLVYYTGGRPTQSEVRALEEADKLRKQLEASHAEKDRALKGVETLQRQLDAAKRPAEPVTGRPDAGTPAPSKTDSAKPVTRKADAKVPAKADAAKQTPSKPDAAKQPPGKPEAAKQPPGKPEASKSSPAPAPASQNAGSGSKDGQKGPAPPDGTQEKRGETQPPNTDNKTSVKPEGTASRPEAASPANQAPTPASKPQDAGTVTNDATAPR
ncbi:MAG TPA: Stp1/IreP family PP2C-type Ser/Thr phosphatase [Candidatus Acidoferrum sp.]|nr:Stp1/IreP family PP2C-type Ser/Thr phosphatase [Candidatus Acidoferrum sp.]